MTHSSKRYVVFFGLLMFAVLVSDSLAQKRSDLKGGSSPTILKSRAKSATQKDRGSQSKSTQPVVEVDVETQAKLLGFVNEHHPELTRLLKSLEKSRPRRYQQAMRQLASTHDRLQRLKREGRPKSYETALAQWKLSSRIKLKAAELAVKDTEINRTKLNALIAKQVDDRIESLKAEEDRARTRLENVVSQLERLENREREIQKNMESVLRTVNREFPKLNIPRGDSTNQSPKEGAKSQRDLQKKGKQSGGKAKKSDKKSEKKSEGGLGEN